MIEYRMADGRRLNVVADKGKVRLVNSENEKINIRSMGCPGWLASKVEVRRAAPAAPATTPVQDVMQIRRANTAMAGPLIAQAKRDLEALSLAPYSYDGLRMHLEQCSSMAEAAYASAATIESLLDSWPDDDAEDNSGRSFVMQKKRDLHRALRESHKQSHVALGIACMRVAETMIHVGKVAAKVQSAGNGDSDD